MQADFNHNDFTNDAEADKSLMVRFFYKERPDKTRTAEEGRPVFKEVIYVEIRIAGQRDVQACRPATEADKQRFSRHLEAFEKRVEPPVEGMPLSEWPQITRSEVEELSFVHVKTVEQLASMKDSNLGKFRGGYALRDKAVKWLEMNDKETVDREKEELRDTIAAMQAQIAALTTAKTPTPAKVEPVVEELEETKVETAAYLASQHDDVTDEEPEGAAEVPAAPAARPKRRARGK
jgi:hypothetical protein